MIATSKDPSVKQLAAQILFDQVGVVPTAFDQHIVWYEPSTNEVEWVTGFTGVIGKTCQMHVVNLGARKLNRDYLRACFDYPFNKIGLDAVIGIVNSNNHDAMRFDTKLGFKEFARMPGLHEDGGDIVILQMKRDDCRWIKGNKNAL